LAEKEKPQRCEQAKVLGSASSTAGQSHVVQSVIFDFHLPSLFRRLTGMSHFKPHFHSLHSMTFKRLKTSASKTAKQV